MGTRKKQAAKAKAKAKGQAETAQLPKRAPAGEDEKPADPGGLAGHGPNCQCIGCRAARGAARAG